MKFVNVSIRILFGPILRKHLSLFSEIFRIWNKHEAV